MKLCHKVYNIGHQVTIALALMFYFFFRPSLRQFHRRQCEEMLFGIKDFVHNFFKKSELAQ